MSYRRKSTPVEAWQYQGQPQAEWPAFVRDFQAYTQLGLAKASTNNMGTMFLPQAGAQGAVVVNTGDWLVQEGDKLVAFKGGVFAAMFEAVEGEPEA